MSEHRNLTISQQLCPSEDVCQDCTCVSNKVYMCELYKLLYTLLYRETCTNAERENFKNYNFLCFVWNYENLKFVCFVWNYETLKFECFVWNYETLKFVSIDLGGEDVWKSNLT